MVDPSRLGDHLIDRNVAAEIADSLLQSLSPKQIAHLCPSFCKTELDRACGKIPLQTTQHPSTRYIDVGRIRKVTYDQLQLRRRFNLLTHRLPHIIGVEIQ